MSRRASARRWLRLLACIGALGAAACEPAPETDAALEQRVNERLRSDAVVGGNEVDARVASGRVTLTGSVETQDRRERAERLARSVRGVRDLSNEIQLRSPPAPGTPEVSARGPAPPPPAPGSTGNPPAPPPDAAPAQPAP